jgi:hypothetical protein
MNDVAVSIDNLAGAFAKAQAEFDQIRREKLVTVTMKSGGKYTFTYAPLETILRATVPALAKYGLAITQSVVEDAVETKLLYGQESLTTRVKIINTEGGAQAYGSALTYARRYGITLLLCVCADDDDDANAAEGNTTQVQHKAYDQPITPKGDMGKQIDPDLALATATAMRGILELDVDEKVKMLKVLDKHDILNKDADLYVAASDALSTKEKSAWRTYVSLAKAAQKADSASDPSRGRKF